ncbi:MAG: ThuA domain-containing protein [Planctomycetota bacterium]|jgi:type 1 glutamine amidotransferase
MNKSEIKKLTACILIVSGLFVSLGCAFVSITDKVNAKKKALAILGDAHHSVFPQYSAIVKELQKKGYHTDVIMDYDVPFKELSEYDIVVLSRYAYNDVVLCKEYNFNFAKGKDNLWLTSEQEQAFEDFVKAGGRLFLHHDGIGFYLKNRAISRLAKAYFITHPPVGTITVKPSGNFPDLTKGVEPFDVVDEEYIVEIDESQTEVFLESHSEENGRFVQGWAHKYGKGRVAVLIPGHDKKVLFHPMVKQCIQNVIEWLDK